MVTTVTKNNRPADDLENRSFSELGGAANEPNAEDQQAEAQQAQAMAAIEAGAAKVLYALFKIARSLIARQLPEILDEWSDAIIKEPATAAVPLLKKHLEKAMAVLGANPELAVFAMSLIPLGMGYITAMERHDKTPPADVVENITPLHAI